MRTNPTKSSRIAQIIAASVAIRKEKLVCEIICCYLFSPNCWISYGCRLLVSLHTTLISAGQRGEPILSITEHVKGLMIFLYELIPTKTSWMAQNITSNVAIRNE